MREVGFLFDNDGVLIDSHDFHWLAWQEFMRKEQKFFMDEKSFKATFGQTNHLILSKLSPQLTQEEREEWAEKKEKLFRKFASENIKLLPGIENFLKEIVAKKIPHIIASSAPVANLEMFLSSTPLGNYFSHFVSAEQVAHSKPAPDVFLEAAKCIHLPASSCIVLEDSPAGLKAGRDAGAFVVALETTYNREYLSDYDLVYPSPKELVLSEILEAFDAWAKMH